MTALANSFECRRIVGSGMDDWRLCRCASRIYDRIAAGWNRFGIGWKCARASAARGEGV
jgi:hypothetical protein